MKNRGLKLPATLKTRQLSPLWSITGFCMVGVIWEVVAALAQSPFIPSITRISVALYRLLSGGEALTHVSASLGHILVGLSIALLLGFFLGLVLSQSRLANAILLPVVDAIRSVAALTLFPLIILILGLGLWSKAFVIFWTAWPAILLSTQHSITHVPSEIVEAGMLDGAGRAKLLALVSLPVASPGIMSGIRIGVGGGWISLVAAEMLGSSSGLGYFVIASSQTFRYPEMYAAIILIALLGLAMNTGLLLLQQLLEKKLCLLESK
jgi:ABC-type nitrate/sulfonate/bicarbonate transport system permease component